VISEKQSSFYFQAITAQTTIRNNVVFNIPRAGINFNVSPAQLSLALVWLWHPERRDVSTILGCI
jgi:hypothetical protein